MSQPIEERFKQLEDRIQKIEQQNTEPIKVIVERRQVEIERTQDTHTAMLQELSRKSDTHTAALQNVIGIVTPMNRELAQVQLHVNAIDRRAIAIENKIEGMQADSSSIKATQSDHSELLIEQSKRFDKVEARLEAQGKLLTHLQEKSNIQEDLLRQILAKLS